MPHTRDRVAARRRRLLALTLLAAAATATGCSVQTPDPTPTGGSATSTRAPTRAPSSGTGTIGGAAVTYDSGVAVSVPSAERYTPSSTAVGHHSDHTGVIVTVTLTNGSAKAIDGQDVVVGVKGGGAFTGQIFDPDKNIDTGLSGTVAAGATATAEYAFDVPDDSLDDITVNVYPDLTTLATARFTGQAA